jgi:hypothetical protein
MALTRAQVEQAIVNSTSGFMSGVGMAVTYTGSNADLAQPIDNAMRALGYAVEIPLAPSDTDLQAVPDARLELLLGVVRLFTIRACVGRFAEIDEQAGTDEQKLDQLGKRMQAEAAALAEDLLNRYGFGRRRRRHPRIGQLATGTWPPPPPPPMSRPPYPPGTPIGGGPSPFFNP